MVTIKKISHKDTTIVCDPILIVYIPSHVIQYTSSNATEAYLRYIIIPHPNIAWSEGYCSRCDS